MTILCYHTVEPDWDRSLAVTPGDFEEQCKWLASRRRVVPVNDLIPELDARWRPRKGLAAITFDDGWSGVYSHAWPILRRHGLPFTVFVVADTMNDSALPIGWVSDAPDQPLRVLSREQIREMHVAGVDIASHSLRHADLTAIGYEACVEDLRESRRVLEHVIGAPVETLAYPFGRHSEDVRRAAEAAGFKAAFSLPEQREPVNRFAIPRVGVYPGNTTRGLAVKTSRRYLDVRLSAGWHRLRGSRRSTV